MKKNQKTLTVFLVIVGLILLTAGYKQYDKWYNPAKREFNLALKDFLSTKPKQICNESLGGMTDVSPRNFYHVYYYSSNPDVEQIVVNSAKPRGYKLTEDVHAENQRVQNYNDHTKYLTATSNFGSLDIAVAPESDKVTLYCGSLGNYENYGKTITPSSGQKIIEFRLTKK